MREQRERHMPRAEWGRQTVAAFGAQYRIEELLPPRHGQLSERGACGFARQRIERLELRAPGRGWIGR